MIARALALVLVLLVAAAPALAERRVALVVGNSSYREAPLRNPANDARAMADALKRVGFEVLLRQNLSKPQLERAIAEFGDKLAGGADTVGLFFYAGHGMQLRGRNYLVPVDAQIASEQRVRIETVDVDLVLEQMQAANARVSVAILDACRNNPFERRFRSMGGGLAQMDAPEGTLIAYATAPGTVAADGEGANGLYTAELLRALARPGLKIEEVFKQTRAAVARTSANAQVPWESSSLTGDFYFLAPVPGAVATAVAAPAIVAPAPPAPRSELQAWEAVKDSARTAELEAFLDEFPDGPFAPLARLRIAEILSRATTPPRSAAYLGPLEGRFYAAIPAEVVANRLGEIQLTVDVKDGRITGGGVNRRNQICRAIGQITGRGVILRLDVTCEGQIAASFIGGRFPDDANPEPSFRAGWMRARRTDDTDTVDIAWETVK